MTIKHCLVLAGAVAAIGCGKTTANPIGVKATNQHLVAVDTDSPDPYTCRMSQVDETSPLHARLADGGVIQSYEPVGDSHSALLGVCKQNQQVCWYTREEQAFNDDQTMATFTFDMVCQFPCDVASDCPAPSAGTAVASCVNVNPAIPKSGQCALDCTDGRTCPDGFACLRPGLATVGPDYQQSPSPMQCMQTKVVTWSAPASTDTPADAGAGDGATGPGGG